jgi:PAS domain S-box-containing protein
MSDMREELPVASILLVDDHPPNLVVLEAALAPLGQRLVRADSGPEALKRVAEEDFAAILLDVQMPELDGYQTARLIKSQERARHVPLLFLTASQRDERQMLRGYLQGAVDYLLKPLDPDVLRAKVAVFVDVYQRQEQLRRREARLREQERELLVRQTEAHSRALLEAMPQAVWSSRPDESMAWCNPAWMKLMGGQQRVCSCEAFLEAVHPEEREGVEEAWREALRTGRSWEAQHRMGRPEAWRWHRLRVTPLAFPSKQSRGFLCTATDIHDERRSQEVAQEANRLKDEFLATLSHELRTPLTSILGWTQMLLEREGLDEAGLRRGLTAIERNARVQRQLVEDLLDIARITSGKLRLNLKEVQLREVVEAALESVRPAAEAGGVLLQAELEDVSQSVLADVTRLQQVLWNLLTNAIKFTDRGGSVCLALRQEGETVRLTVRDTGRGIPRELLPHIFERFRQGDTGREQGGLGLGLAIVRHLVELHGGSVSVASEGIGTGATFTVQLPLRPQQPERVSEPVALECSGRADGPRQTGTSEALFAMVATLMRQAAH